MPKAKARPAWWCDLHDNALAALTSEWQHMGALRKQGVAVVVLDDLVWADKADVKREPITVNGIAAGEYVFFRRAAPPPEAL